MALTSEDKTYIKETTTEIVKAAIHDALEEFAIVVNDSFQAMHQRFDLLEIRVGNLESKTAILETRFTEMDGRLERKIDLLFDAIAYRSEDSAVKAGR